MFVTGTGTQADPYICGNWDELISVSTTASNYIKMADSDSRTIDFNSIYPDGLNSNIILYGNIDFNGWTLTNLYIPSNQYKITFGGTQTANNCFIKNLNFTNFLKRGSGEIFYVISSSPSNFKQFYNCVFSGEFDNGVSNDSAYLCKCPMYNCSVNVVSNSTGYIYLTTIKGENCWFNVAGKMNRLYIGATDNCLISGSITTSDTISLSINNGSVRYSVFDINANGTLYTANGTTSIYNSEKISLRSEYSYMIGVTSEQMINAEYLQSIGFPIGVD